MPEQDETAIKFLTKQNKNLVVKIRLIFSAKSPSGKGKDFVFTINYESLENLKRSERNIKFGFGYEGAPHECQSSHQSTGTSGGLVYLNHCEAATEDLMLIISGKGPIWSHSRNYGS